MTDTVHERLVAEVTEAARIASERFPTDYDAALRYLRDLVSEDGAHDEPHNEHKCEDCGDTRSPDDHTCPNDECPSNA